ncbi:MAG: PEP-CTERM sorting domain-containing protein [Aquabacterium sp.]|uniref:PEP-CTERM sorting domain-containing protein n=1 Tax=Aquabacterium sp. TaxID=1872578 RepID=UPI002719A8E2|nr:PEP-CTERM sorting domain-containing protein [Aquabacterium sp.]MDO9002519.1 PEP-CTERM sorting domain-containing protein [Aquabacterium sp.]
MKFAFKSIVAVAATLVAASGAHASDWELISGTGGLTFSTDALSALSASGSAIVTPFTVPTIAGLDISGSANTAAYTKATGNVSLTFSSAVAFNDSLVSLQAANSFVQIRRITFNDDETTTTRSIFMTNFDVNLSTSTISADLYSRLNSGALVNYGKQDIFRADLPGVIGGTQGNIEVIPGTGFYPQGQASGSLAGSLRMNLATADIILADLGLSTAATDPVATLVRTANWGTTQAAGTLQAIPEPSSYAMFGMGLLALGVAMRRRGQAA